MRSVDLHILQRTPSDGLVSSVLHCRFGEYGRFWRSSITKPSLGDWISEHFLLAKEGIDVEVLEKFSLSLVFALLLLLIRNR